MRPNAPRCAPMRPDAPRCAPMRPDEPGLLSVTYFPIAILVWAGAHAHR